MSSSRVETQVSRRSLRRVSSSESSGSGSFLGAGVVVVVGTGVEAFSVDLGAMVDGEFGQVRKDRSAAGSMRERSC